MDETFLCILWWTLFAVAQNGTSVSCSLSYPTLLWPMLISASLLLRPDSSSPLHLSTQPPLCLFTRSPCMLQLSHRPHLSAFASTGASKRTPFTFIRFEVRNHNCPPLKCSVFIWIQDFFWNCSPKTELRSSENSDNLKKLDPGDRGGF